MQLSFFCYTQTAQEQFTSTKALLVFSRNTIAILIYLYLLLGHISPSADQIDAVYRFCLAVSASTFALSFHQTHQLPTGMLSTSSRRSHRLPTRIDFESSGAQE